MAFDFPTNPTVNEIYSDGDYSFMWDGNSWVTSGSIASYGALNTQIVSTGSYANSAFTKANGAFIKANTAGIAANTPSLTANLAFNHANAAYNAANSAADTWVRNQANSAFQAANSAGVYANSSFIHANAAFNAVNSVSATAITNGTSNVKVVSSGGNVQITIGGTTQTTISSNLISHNEGVLENIMYRVNSLNVTSNIVISNAYNYMSVGPITINSGITVNVANGARWAIV